MTLVEGDPNWLIGLVGRVFANGPGDLGSIPGHVIPKTLKTVLDITLLNTQQYWTSPGGNTPQGTNYTATSLPSWKLSKLDEPDMQDTAGEAGTSS